MESSIAIFLLGAILGTMFGIALMAIISLPDKYKGDCDNLNNVDESEDL